AISGSSVATAASIGGVALPQLVARNYDRPLAAGSLAAGGTLGILFPPSLAMIIYGAFTETSVAKLFMAGVVPGLILTAMFMIYIAAHALVKPNAAPREHGPGSLAEVFLAISEVLPFLFLISGTLGLIYLGLVTPTEAAAGGCICGIIISRIWGDLRWRVFLDALRRTVRLLGNLLFIVYAAYVFSYAISFAGIGEEVTAFLVGLKLNRVEFFVALFILY